jgi:predicted secreted hydrolase
MKRSHWRLRLATTGAVMGAVAIMLSNAVPAGAQALTGTYPPRPQIQTGGTPTPVPPSDVVLSLPQDQYLHEGAPTEWWWYMGTLKAGNRTFGFEINAASFQDRGFSFSQISLTDVKNQTHYQRTAPYLVGAPFNGSTWAQSDPTQPWSAALGSPSVLLSGVQVTSPGHGYTKASVSFTGGGGTGATGMAVLNKTGGVEQILVTDQGTGYTKEPTVVVTGDGTGAKGTAYNSYVSATAPASNPTDMSVKALLVDDPTMKQVKYNLNFSQVAKPFWVFGTGVDPLATEASLTANNYYYSLTHLMAKGTITFGGKTYNVHGVTWMDHEYGRFGSADHPVQWILQDFQLANGWTISNAGIVDEGKSPQLNVPFKGYATLESPDGKMYYVASTATPTGGVWTSPSGKTYFTKMQVNIPLFNAKLDATALMKSQEFPGQVPVYEGVAAGKGTFQGKSAAGNAWIEETF